MAKILIFFNIDKISMNKESCETRSGRNRFVNKKGYIIKRKKKGEINRCVFFVPKQVVYFRDNLLVKKKWLTWIKD